MIRKRFLGEFDIELAELGFGAWAIGGKGDIWNYGDIDKDQAEKIIHKYFDKGGNYIDTARVYNKSEYYLGEYFKDNGGRENTIISTKTMAGDCIKTIPKIRKDLETSLSLMNTDYIDILFLHNPPEDDEVINETLEELSKLKKEGKIRLAGASIKGVNVTLETERLCRNYISTGKIDVIQLVYSILRQRHSDVISEAYKNGVGIIARTALESGLLSGKYKPGHKFEGDDQRTRYDPDNLQFILKKVQEIGELAVKKPYETLAQTAIKFALSHEGISSLIVGAKNIEQMEMNINAAMLPDISDDSKRIIQEKFKDINEKSNYH